MSQPYTWSNTMEMVGPFGLLFLVVVISLMISFSPTIIALCRRHARTGTIFTFNLLVFVLASTLGLFLYGLGFVLFPIWVWIFIWAVMGAKKPPLPCHHTFFPEVQQQPLMKS
jgi:hypothetical protein